MVSISIKTRCDASRVYASFAAMNANIPDELFRVMSKTGKQIQKDARANLEKYDAIATGDTWEKIVCESVRSALIVHVESKAEQTRWIQGGRRPGAPMPPEEPIMQWIMDKGLVDANVFLIRRAIAEHGIKAKPFFDDAVDDNLRGFPGDCIAAVNRAVRESMR